jgi:hypothetical protein
MVSGRQHVPLPLDFAAEPGIDFCAMYADGVCGPNGNAY